MQKSILSNAPIIPKNITLIQAENDIPCGAPVNKNDVGLMPQYADNPAPIKAEIVQGTMAE